MISMSLRFQRQMRHELPFSFAEWTLSCEGRRVIGGSIRCRAEDISRAAIEAVSVSMASGTAAGLVAANAISGEQLTSACAVEGGWTARGVALPVATKPFIRRTVVASERTC